MVLHEQPHEDRNEQHPGQRVAVEQLERKIGGQNQQHPLNDSEFVGHVRVHDVMMVVVSMDISIKPNVFVKDQMDNKKYEIESQDGGKEIKQNTSQFGRIQR